MLEAANTIHMLGIIHCDIKTDNWVLRRSADDANELEVCLIDFGKARATFAESPNESGSVYDLNDMDAKYVVENMLSLERRQMTSSSIQLAYRGRTSAKGYAMQDNGNRSWTFENDYYGLCACMNQLLLFGPMNVIKENRSAIMTRGFKPSSSNTSSHYYVPCATLKR